jgi:Mn-containing catalase
VSYAFLGFQHDGSDPVAGRWSTGPSIDGKGTFSARPAEATGGAAVLGPAKPNGGAQLEQL